MKTLNQFRNTNTVKMTSSHLQAMVQVQTYLNDLDWSLIGIAYENDSIDTFVCRVTTKKGDIIDVEVIVRGTRVSVQDVMSIFINPKNKLAA